MATSAATTKLKNSRGDESANSASNNPGNRRPKSRYDQLRSVIRSIETFNQENIGDDTDNNEKQQNQQYNRPCPQLLAILRLLYHARTPRQFSEAGRELEDLLLLPDESENSGHLSDKHDGTIPATTTEWKKNTSRPIQERIVKVCALAGLQKLATKLLQQLLREEKYLPTSVSYLSVCQLLKKLGRCDQLREVLLDMAAVAKDTDQYVDVIAFNTYLACLCQDVKPQKQSNLQVAHKYLSQPSSSVNNATLGQDIFAVEELDVVSYNTILHGASLANNHTLADMLWEEMKSLQHEGRLRLDTLSYNTRLQTFNNFDYNARLRFVEEELLLFNDAGADGKADVDANSVDGTGNGYLSTAATIKADRYTIDFLLMPLIRAGRIGDIEGLLDSFVSTNSERVVSTAFAAYLNTLVKSGEVYSARALFDTYISPSVQARQKRRMQELKSGTVSDPSVLLGLNRKVNDSNALMVRPIVRHFNVLIDGYRRLAELCSKRQLQQNNNKNKYKQDKSPTMSPKKSRNMESENEKSDLSDDRDETIDPQVARAEGWTLYRLMIDDAQLLPDHYTVSSMVGLCTTSEELTEFLFGHNVENSTSDARHAVLDSLSVPAVLRAAITAYGKLGDPSSSCILFDIIGSEKVHTNNSRMWNVLLGALAEGAKRNNVRLSLQQPVEERTSLLNFLSDPKISNSSLSSLIDGKTCTEAVEILLDQMTSSRSAPHPNTQTFCIAASTMQHSSAANATMAVDLFRNAMSIDGISADGRFVNAIFRCFGDDIDEALAAWKREIRKACVDHENRPRSEPPSNQRTRAKNLVAAYNGLLYVCGRAIRPDIAVRVAYAMNREGLEPNDVSLNNYNAGKRRRQRADRGRKKDTDARSEKPAAGAPSDTKSPESRKFGFASSLKLKVPKLIPKLDFVEQYENLLYVECTKYNQNDKRREGDKRVRIIV